MSLDSPSATGRANARGMARVMALFANHGELDGKQVLSKAGVQEALAGSVQSAARNHEKEVNPFYINGGVADTAFTHCGLDAYHLKVGVAKARLREFYGETAFGWGGFGGSVIFCDPTDNIGFGYTVTGGMDGDTSVTATNARSQPLLRALRACVDKLNAAGGAPSSKL